MTWYCIRTARRAELSLVDELRAIGLVAYTPCEIHDRKIAGRRQRVTVPAMRGYVFVFCDPSDFAAVSDCEGFWRFVRYVGSETPAKMARGALMDVFLADLFGDLDYTRQPEAYRPRRGDAVRIRSGMWRGRIARIISVGKRKSLLEPLDGFGRWEVNSETLELAA